MRFLWIVISFMIRLSLSQKNINKSLSLSQKNINKRVDNKNIVKLETCCKSVLPCHAHDHVTDPHVKIAQFSL